MRSAQRDAQELILWVPRRLGFFGGVRPMRKQGKTNRRKGWSRGATKEATLPLDAGLSTTPQRSLL